MSRPEADERIAAALARRGQRHRARADFDERLWAAIDQQAPPVAGRRRRGSLAAAGIALAAAAVVLIVALRADRGGQRAPVPELAVEIVPGSGPARRSTAAQPGDRVRVTAAWRAPHVELRLYRGDRVLVARCSTEPPCRRDGGALTATVPLPSAGDYHLVVLTAPAPLPEPAGDLDGDVAAAIEAGADATWRRLEVR